MEKTNITEIITKYFKAVCDAYSLGNVESSYNAPIMALFTDIGCAARDLSGERKGQSGENIDIKLWHTEEEVTETEPFAGVEVKKVGGIDKRALSVWTIPSAHLSMRRDCPGVVIYCSMTCTKVSAIPQAT